MKDELQGAKVIAVQRPKKYDCGWVTVHLGEDNYVLVSQWYDIQGTYVLVECSPPLAQRPHS